MSLALGIIWLRLTTQRIAWRRQKLVLAMVMLALLPCRLAFASDNSVALDIWVQQAPLEMVIEQIASVAGKSVKITGVIDGQVSGRFSGNLADTLTMLSATHDVSFDLQDNNLYAVSNRALSNISIALPGSDAAVALVEEAIGVIRIVSLSGASEEIIETTKTLQSTADTPLKNDDELKNSVKLEVTDMKDAEKLSSKAEVELKPARRIRSVTDIPGFYTF
jgi:hypothetical protein